MDQIQKIEQRLKGLEQKAAKLEAQKEALNAIEPLAPQKIGKVTLNTPMLQKMALNEISAGVKQILIAQDQVKSFGAINPETNRLRRAIVAWHDGSAKEPYVIKAHERHRLSCSCPDWRYRMKPDHPETQGRWCKHVEACSKYIRVGGRK